MPKDLKGILGDWIKDYEEDGVDGDVAYDRVVEHYAFFEDNTGFYECFYLLGDKLVGSLFNREDVSFKYGLIAPGHVGLFHSKDTYGYLLFRDGKLTDPNRLAYSRPSEEMAAQMNTWANLLNPDWLAQKLIGKWMLADIGGNPALTNQKSVITFVSATKAFMSKSFDKPDGGTPPSGGDPDLTPGQGPKPEDGPEKPGWDDYEEFDVTIQGNRVTLDNVKQTGPNISLSYLILDISDTDFVCEFAVVPEPSHRLEGEEGDKEIKTEIQRFERIESNYASAAIGLWEGKVTSSEDEYTDGKLHRWELNTDNTYIYYRQDETGAWVDDVNESAKYFIDGTLLCMRWKNVGEGQKENREWWEIVSIEDGVMKWKALRQREDGSTYIASFSMNYVYR